MTPPKTPGVIPDPELPTEQDHPSNSPKRRKKNQSRPGEPTRDAPRKSPPTRQPLPKDQPTTDEPPDEVEW